MRNKHDLRGVGYIFLAALPFIIGLLWLTMTTREFNLWLHQDRYIDAEIEVTRFDYTGSPEGINTQASGRSRGQMRNVNRIEGIIHPTGERVVTNDQDVHAAVYDVPNGRVGRVPLPQEIVGKRVRVLYWPNHADEYRWYHPPTTLSAVRPTTRAVLVDGSVVLVLLSVASISFRTGCRLLNRPATIGSHSSPLWPTWTLLAVVGVCVLWFLTWVMSAAVLRNDKLVPTTGARVPLTTREWLVTRGSVAVLATPALFCTGLMGYAIYCRFQRRSTLHTE